MSVQPNEPLWTPGPDFDWTRWYIEPEDDVGQSVDQFESILLLVVILTQWARAQEDVDTLYVGSDVFFGWVEEHPKLLISPEVFIMQPPPEGDPLPSSIQTWRDGHPPPRLAVEVVSKSNWRKDYRDLPL